MLQNGHSRHVRCAIYRCSPRRAAAITILLASTSTGEQQTCNDHGAEVDPDTQDRRFSQAALDEVTAFRDRRFPGLRGAPMIGAEVCQYENSSSGDFLIDRHPGHANVVMVGGGSGHGFKHGPEVGRLAAELVYGGAIKPRFSLATKLETQHRSVV